jgi:hypothetical protein
MGSSICALRVFEKPYVDATFVTRRWRFIACNECVLELYHLRSRLEKIQAVLLRSCPSLRGLLDGARIRRARKMLDDYFPDVEPLRHATAHKGENEAFPEKHSGDDFPSLTGFREPDRFSLPFEGELRYLDITNQSLQRITEIVNEFFKGFEVAAAELEKQGHID